MKDRAWYGRTTAVMLVVCVAAGAMAVVFAVRGNAAAATCLAVVAVIALRLAVLFARSRAVRRKP